MLRQSKAQRAKADAYLQLPKFFNNGHHHVQEVTRLHGGLTNETYLVRTTDAEYVVRIPGKGSSEYINRENESYNTAIAVSAGVTPEVVYDERNGVKVTRYLKNPVTMCAAALRRPENLLMVANAVKQLHSAESFANDVDVFACNREMHDILHSLQYALPEKYLAVTEKMNAIEKRISEYQFDKTPCHNDTTPSNFILSDGKMHIIDLEYSGNNDPLWDLAVLAMEAELTEHQCGFLLRAYYGDMLTAEIRQRFYLYQPLVEYTAALWCHLQMAQHNQVAAPGELSSREWKKFSRCLAALESNDFAEALAPASGLEEVVSEPEATTRSGLFARFRR